MRTKILMLVPLLLGGCFTQGYSLKDRFMEAQEKYNNSVHWGQLEAAVPYLPKEEQHAFVERMSALEDELEFSETDLQQYDLDKKHDKVKARMVYTWSLKRHGILEKTVTEQTWKEKSGKLILIREVRLRGAPLPLWKEKAEVAEAVEAEAAEDAGTSKKKDQWKYSATAGGPSPSSE
jgi:hypothetical protein